jgi:hypothetical protein
VSFQSTPADPLIKRVETVGKILPHTKAKVVDKEGKVVPVGTPGEIIVAGYLLQKGSVDLRGCVLNFFLAEWGFVGTGMRRLKRKRL